MSSELQNTLAWHDVECGAYADDLPTWDELAEAADGPVVELGCGTGRVALHLAARGHEVTGVDSDPMLIEALRGRAAEAGVGVRTLVADVTELELDARAGLVIAPMQIAQILGGPARREAMLAGAATHLDPGGTFAAAIITDAHLFAGSTADEVSAPLPDVRELDGWVHSSLPLAVTLIEGGRIASQRLRQVVSPGGELFEEVDITMFDHLSPAQLAAEAEPVGLRARTTREIPENERFIGSTVCIFERA